MLQFKFQVSEYNFARYPSKRVLNFRLKFWSRNGDGSLEKDFKLKMMMVLFLRESHSTAETALEFGYKFYDFNKPLTFDAEFLNSFDLVIAYPRFLSRECFEKTAITVNALKKKKNGKVMVCTGTFQKNLVLDLVGAKITKFKPQHENGLSNDFSCFLNYESDDVKFFFQDDIEE